MASESIDGDAAGADGGGAVDLLISIARWRLEEQISRVRSLDTKVTATFTLNAAVVALFGAALALSPGALAYHVWALFASVLALFIVSLGYAYRALRRRDWRMRPNLAALDALIEQAAAEQVKIWTAREIMLSIEDNERLLVGKDASTRRAIAFAIADVVLIGATALAVTSPFG